MLELRNIHKDYVAGNSTVEALKGVSLAFRDNEFVAVLGHSGCGKTTLLNIIGGLDHYSQGDLIINGVSTKKYKDRDWDAYRNHSVGFIFQSYNLIPHQSVLANVELALTISGVSKAERRRRAKEALEKVGLGDQLHKRPNQMSGGQMQRVAIARALVNDPDILLADEPTGALDSDTSVQVMDLIREIAKDRLVIMVTHNPELAEAYANRIVRIKDGLVIDDTNPFTPPVEPPKAEKAKRVSMSFFTALSLSMNNLLTKKGRTFMTSFAGSIGIIGIALILSLSNGINLYINGVQEDTLSSYPLTIEAESSDLTAMMESFMQMDPEASAQAHGKDKVYANTAMYEMFNQMNSATVTTNNMAPFKAFLDADAGIQKYASAIQYTYDLQMPIYTEDAAGTLVKSDFSEMMIDALGTGSSPMMDTQYDMFSEMDIWQEMLVEDTDTSVSSTIKSQYDLIYGAWPTAYNEVVLVLNKNNEVSDLVLYILGFKDSSKLPELMQKAMAGEVMDDPGITEWSYADICAKKYRLILPVEQWQKNSATGTYTDMSLTVSGMEFLYNSEDIGTDIKITGILRPAEDASAGMLNGTICYTRALTEHIITTTQNSDIVKAQKADPDTDVFTGLPFLTEDSVLPTEEEKVTQIKAYIKEQSVTDQAKMYTYIAAIPADEYVEALVQQQMQGLTRQQIEQQVIAQYTQEMQVDAETVADYIAQMDDQTLFDRVKEALSQGIREQYSAQAQGQLALLNDQQKATMLAGATLTQGQYVQLYDEFMPPVYAEADYEENSKLLGMVDKADPAGVNIYALTFKDKDRISDIIDGYNKTAAEDDVINYTDYVALLMSSITGIISGVSYLLIAFVGISLVVSSIMIGIITYISVLERTREIGILRAIGASKRDISNVFNAETLLVGLTSGLIGIGASLLLNIPINMIVHHFTDLDTLRAALPPVGAIILVVISMSLTLIAGLIPSRFAAKKDPVEALRTE